MLYDSLRTETAATAIRESAHATPVYRRRERPAISTDAANAFARFAALRTLDRADTGSGQTATRRGTRRTPRTDEPLIVAAGVSKRYRLGKDNDVHALRGASLHIDAGEMVAIVGPSGSGKSTVMHLIGCLDTPDAGEIRIAGRRVDNLRGEALTKLRGTEIGFIFQGFNLVPTMSAVDNVALAAEYAGASRKQALERARELLALVGLADRGGHLPSELSGGQQQRVAIARALVNKPAIVLGDEPTGDLDTATSDEIVALMRRINTETGTTFVIVTHNPEVAEACDRTIAMRDGRVADDGFEAALRCCPNEPAPRERGSRTPAPSPAPA